MLRNIVVALVFAGAVAGCSDLGAPLRPRAQPELSALELDFGTVALSDSATRVLAVRNTGTGDLVGEASLSCGQYTLEGGGPFAIPPGGSKTLVLRFHPSGIGSFPCTLDLGPQCPQVAVSGVGAFQAVGASCIVVPDSLDFGTLSVGDSALRTFRLFSTGTAPVDVNIVSSCADFSVLAGGGPATLAPNTSITVTVRFQPQTGLGQTCAIQTGPGCPDVSVAGFATTISFSGDIRPIFENWCAGCHAFADPTSGYAALLGTPSAYPPARIVVPFDLVRSTLYGKITDSRQYGALMPQGGPMLPQADRDRIRSWILEGARNN